jgi:hypothetical protein
MVDAHPGPFLRALLPQTYHRPAHHEKQGLAATTASPFGESSSDHRGP